MDSSLLWRGSLRPPSFCQCCLLLLGYLLYLLYIRFWSTQCTQWLQGGCAQSYTRGQDHIYDTRGQDHIYGFLPALRFMQSGKMSLFLNRLRNFSKKSPAVFLGTFGTKVVGQLPLPLLAHRYSHWAIPPISIKLAHRIPKVDVDMVQKVDS